MKNGHTGGVGSPDSTRVPSLRHSAFIFSTPLRPEFDHRFELRFAVTLSLAAMNASTSSTTSAPQPRRLVRPFVIGLLLLGLGGAVGAGFWHVHARQQLGDLEHQLLLAQRYRNADAVGEIARRIARLDGSPSRLLALAECFVQVRRFDDLENALGEVERLAPERGSEVVRLRARAAAAQAQWNASIALWEEYLAGAAVPGPDRVTALDELVTIFVWQGRWEQARARSDRRLALADAVAARLVRAQVETRLRQWAAVGEDFRHLKATAPADAVVKDALPAWERIERALQELETADAAVNAAPTGLGARLERAMVCARLGLWQNAADDLKWAAEAFPTARMPALFAAGLGLRSTFAQLAARAINGDFARSLPWLASTHVLSGFLERTDGHWEAWRELATLDRQLTAPEDSGERTAYEVAHLRAGRALVLCDLGLPEPALREATELLKAMPDFLPAERVVIAAHLASGELIRAGQAADRAMAGHGADPGAPDPELLRLAALAWQAQGRHAQAVEALTACLAGAKRADLLRARAKSLRQLQRFTEAAQDLASAEVLDAAAATEGVK